MVLKKHHSSPITHATGQHQSCNLPLSYDTQHTSLIKTSPATVYTIIVATNHLILGRAIGTAHMVLRQASQTLHNLSPQPMIKRPMVSTLENCKSLHAITWTQEPQQTLMRPCHHLQLDDWKLPVENPAEFRVHDWLCLHSCLLHSQHRDNSPQFVGRTKKHNDTFKNQHALPGAHAYLHLSEPLELS